MTDKIHRFIFDTHSIRGELVKLDTSCQQMLRSHNYPDFIASLLQQAAAIGALLATTLKFEGKIAIQLLTQDKIKMLIVQTTNKLSYRGLVRYDQEADFSRMTFADIVQNGQMSITIEPEQGKRYQGIIPLDGESLAQCIENYFNQSEQLETRIWLFNNETQVCGLMLQALPDMPDKEPFEHLAFLASTLTREESLSTDSDILLHRLFHQESIKNLAVDSVEFSCGCSEKKMLDSLQLLQEEELNEILASQGEVAVKCEFCLNEFRFNELDLKSHGSIRGNMTKH